MKLTLGNIIADRVNTSPPFPQEKQTVTNAVFSQQTQASKTSGLQAARIDSLLNKFKMTATKIAFAQYDK
jgi:hypothetical protein